MNSTLDKLEKAIKKEKSTRKVFEILLEVLNEIKESIDDLEERISEFEQP